MHGKITESMTEDIKRKSKAKLNLFLNKLVGTKCYGNSLIAKKVGDSSEIKKYNTMHKYLRDSMLLKRAMCKSKLVINSYKKNHPDHELCRKKISHSVNSRPAFSLILRRHLRPSMKPRRLDDISNFLDNCGGYLTKSKIEKSVFLMPAKFEDYAYHVKEMPTESPEKYTNSLTGQ